MNVEPFAKEILSKALHYLDQILLQDSSQTFSTEEEENLFINQVYFDKFIKIFDEIEQYQHRPVILNSEQFSITQYYDWLYSDQSQKIRTFTSNNTAAGTAIRLRNRKFDCKNILTHMLEVVTAQISQLNKLKLQIDCSHALQNFSILFQLYRCFLMRAYIYVDLDRVEAKQDLLKIIQKFSKPELIEGDQKIYVEESEEEDELLLMADSLQSTPQVVMEDEIAHKVSSSEYSVQMKDVRFLTILESLDSEERTKLAVNLKRVEKMRRILLCLAYYKLAPMDPTKQEKNYDRSVAYFEPFSSAYNNIGVYHKRDKQYKLAMENFNKAIAYNPKNADSYFNRASIENEHIVNFAGAYNDFQKTIELKPDFQNAWLSFASLLYFCGRVPESYVALNKTVHIHYKPMLKDAQEKKKYLIEKKKCKPESVECLPVNLVQLSSHQPWIIPMFKRSIFFKNVLGEQYISKKDCLTANEYYFASQSEDMTELNVNSVRRNWKNRNRIPYLTFVEYIIAEEDYDSLIL